jgi:ribosomal-protein-alanine N-acetyltransferase
MDLVIRRYVDRDFDSAVSLENAKKGNRYGAAVFIRQAAELYRETFLVAEQDGTVAGFAVGALENSDLSTAWVLRLGIAPRWRGQGIGKALVSQLVAVLGTSGAERILLTVAPGNYPARKIYQKLGFERVDFKKSYFGRGEDREILCLFTGKK